MTEKLKDNSKNTDNIKSDLSKDDAKALHEKYQTLIIHGDKYLTLFTKKYENRKKWTPKNEKHILSYIPGTILKVLVKEGDKVEKDQPLLILEAMKMENTIFAPLTGILKKVNIKDSQKVPKGLVMIEFK